MSSLENEDNTYHCRVSVSTGITEVNEKLTKEQMIKKADEALYCSKEYGRSRISICKTE